MALNEAQQVHETIKRSHHILIVCKKDYSADAIASALALGLVLKKQNKLVDIVCDGFSVPNNLDFLPNIKDIKPHITGLEKFIISLNLKKNAVDEFSYNIENDRLNIYVTPKAGSFHKNDVEATSSGYKYDAIFTIDAPDFDSLGNIYQNFTEFFYDTTIVNIDHSAENEQYGQINLTNPNAVAGSEIIFRLIKTIDQNLLDKDIATCLLTGMIAETKSFKTVTVTPKTLEIASQLLGLEADRDLIIKKLYRSRNLPTLNLWGRVLARLKSRNGNTLVWSLLTDNDFIEAGANPNDLSDVVEELISFVPGVEIVVLIYQFNGAVNVLVNTLKNHNALYLTNNFNPTGSKSIAAFELPQKTLQEAEQVVIDRIKERLGQK
ncbi:MAG: hypothetical protein HUU49_03210 [Candidatus Buchananbacteria bacterium]|nr:hypothetical protein [Candidatus Buchananbacteria bacterium]